MTNHLTHLDANGDIAMVDVSTKTATTRTATATGQVIFPADIYTAIKNADGMTKKRLNHPNCPYRRGHGKQTHP